MKKCVVIPDSFKGTMSAIDVCQIVESSVKSIYPNCEVVSVPVADGGEGTVDCFVYALKAEKITVKTTGPYGEPIEASYARIGDKAIMEMASCAGLPLVGDKLNPIATTTFGLGELVKHAIKNGAKEIVMGLGGSCTNDGATGVARALGTKFFDEGGKEFAPKSDEFVKISRIDNSATEALLAGVKITAMCDIDNPMYGPIGAAHMFGPQKGADAAMVELLDKNIIALSEAIKSSLKKDVAEIPGAGAAGAMGAGVVAFLCGELKSGIETVLDTVNFNDMIKGADMVFTGEGRIDEQSFHGKVINGIANRTLAAKVPLTVIAGDVDDNIPDDVYERGVTAIFSINRKALPYKEIRPFSPAYLRKTVTDVVRLYKCANGE